MPVAVARVARLRAASPPRLQSSLANNESSFNHPVLERSAGAEIKDNILIVGPRIDRPRDVDRDRAERRLPAYADADGGAQRVERRRLVQVVGIARVDKRGAAQAQRGPDRERRLAAQQQFLAAAHLLDRKRHALLVKQRDLGTERI